MFPPEMLYLLIITSALAIGVDPTPQIRPTEWCYLHEHCHHGAYVTPEILVVCLLSNRLLKTDILFNAPYIYFNRAEIAFLQI